ncbi:hypothetical protein CO033_00580 [Candidatus Nomurabacteria bacterium CG_4_9_14_0_2_um_filter_32_10]|uniref:Protein kinase domain-containing protein n=2 Tax=Candidatus Nomuraibacteriota TaxID=1752729 RepID=A0A2H0CG35_9BACT|nr:MAG: hypothetical protein COW91_02505 [Candidatus Nomurabacteria bacterium CG22_combo_CG10-13_8_21_14_all_32_8]PJC49617.1 MAG: hypothetical protein CO033_00580 [Candidatus Nomurabacteria bacterium CG_4_9_14_0_2_um_filter_32_10]
MEEIKLVSNKTQENNFEDKLNEFLKENGLNLEVKPRVETVETLKNSENKEFIEDYVIANDHKLATEASKIFLAYKNGDKQLLVAKENTKEDIDKLIELNNWGNKTVEEHLKEKKFNNPNVILPIETIEKNRKVYRFYEAMDMNLEKYLETHKKLPLKDEISLMMRACVGVEDLNKAGVINVDLAPLNIMLSNNNLKLIDLDGASIINDKDNIVFRNQEGNNRFTAAPELFKKNPCFDKTVDVYAAAVNLYRLIYGNWPYNIEEQTMGISFEEKTNAYKKLHEENNINFPESVPYEIQMVIRKGMSPKPENRYQSIKDFMINLLEAYNKSEKNQ